MLSRVQVACSGRMVAVAPCTRPCAPSAVGAGRGRESPAIAATACAATTSSREPQSGRSARRVIASAAAFATPPSEASALGDVEVSKSVTGVISYALNLARVSETYEAHSWMLLLGLLKHERCRAALILKAAGLTDLYGAWHEVLWALNASNGLQPRAFTNDVRFSDRALRIVVAASNFATWAGRSKVQSEDVLMALAAGNVLTGVFPDLDLTFPQVRKWCAKHGVSYSLPDDTPGKREEVEKEALDM
jgi:hypothetical protein